MGNEGFIVRRDVFEDGLKDRIVGHDVVPFRVLDFHADVFPDLYGNGALSKVMIEAANCIAREVRLTELKGVEGVAESDVSITVVNHVPCLAAFPVKVGHDWVVVVHDEDIQGMQVQLFEECVQLRSALEDVGVGVDGVEGCELVQFLIGKWAGDGGGRSGCGGGGGGCVWGLLLAAPSRHQGENQRKSDPSHASTPFDQAMRMMVEDRRGPCGRAMSSTSRCTANRQ